MTPTTPTPHASPHASPHTSPLASPAGSISPFSNHPLEFTGSGSEYFRVWIVNLLLILVTLGIYLPWAKVRKIKYFYSNTLIDGHALDFHGEPRKMLRGTALAGVFFVLYAQAFRVSPMAGLVASVAIIALWPILFRASLRFRLANTSWRGLRFSFSGGLKESILTVGVPLALVLIPFSVLGFADATAGAASVGAQSLSAPAVIATGVLLVYALLIPYFYLRTARYRHDHYHYGSLRTELRCAPGPVYGVFLKLLLGTLVLAALVGVAFGLVTGISLASLKLAGRGNLGVILASAVLVPVVLIFFNAIVKSYWVVRMQNLIWTRTGNRNVRFVSQLALAPFVWQQFKNYALILLSLGLYWPFAVVATRRMQLEAVTLRSSTSLDAITARAQAESGALGDAAADIFDMDMGL